jgi:ribose transport system substrate-binding protein
MDIVPPQDGRFREFRMDTALLIYALLLLVLWHVHRFEIRGCQQTIDCYGVPARRAEAFSRAMALRPAGIILAGFDAQEHAKDIQAANTQKIPVVGWHAATRTGPADGLFANIGADPKEAGQVAGLLAIVESKAKAGVAVIADTSSAYAAARTGAIVDIIKQCQTCSLLGVEQPAATDAERAVQFAALVKRHGARLTHVIGANDQYFDGVVTAAGMPDAKHLQIIAAGDGIKSAYERINGNGLQIGTVPEPLNMQGWQLVDEINRANSGDKPSGYMPAVYLATSQNKAFHGGPSNTFEPSNGYRAVYRRIWQSQ